MSFNPEHDGPGGPFDATEQPTDAPQEPDGVMDILLHTEPPISPQEAQRDLGGVGLNLAHAYIAIRKGLDAVMGGGGGTGMPMVGNAMLAAFFTFAQGGESEPERERPTDEGDAEDENLQMEDATVEDFEGLL